MEIVAVEKFKSLLSKNKEDEFMSDRWCQSLKSDPLLKDKKLLDKIIRSTKESHPNIKMSRNIW